MTRTNSTTRTAVIPVRSGNRPTIFAKRQEVKFDSCAALITDGDGTLTTRKQLSGETASALERWSESGRKLILATGESVKQLAKFPGLQHFDIVVAENGALLFWPATGKIRLLAKARPASLVRSLRRQRIPLTVGQVIVGTERPYDKILRSTIERLGLDWQVIYNRKDAMALPAGVDKSSGVCAALRVLGLESNAVAGIGDGENDIALLQCCGIGAAIGNAVLCLKNCADLVMTGGSGTGVRRLIDRILAASGGT